MDRNSDAEWACASFANRRKGRIVKPTIARCPVYITVSPVRGCTDRSLVSTGNSTPSTLEQHTTAYFRIFSIVAYLPRTFPSISNAVTNHTLAWPPKTLCHGAMMNKPLPQAPMHGSTPSAHIEQPCCNVANFLLRCRI